jgi:hypothetical protein
LLVVEKKGWRRMPAHFFPSGNPSTRLETMFFWISDEPPSMVLARDRSQSRVY